MPTVCKRYGLSGFGLPVCDFNRVLVLRSLWLTFFSPSMLRFAAVVFLVPAYQLVSANEPLLPVDCVVNPSKQVDLSAAVSGVLDSISVSRSDFVAQGQEVARLESSVELASVELATKRANINAEVNLGEINLGFDRREKKRIAELYQKKAVSYRIKDEADREAKLSEWELQQARDLEDIRWLELKRAHAQLAQKTVRSSISGFVTKVHRSEGEYVEDQPIVRVVQLHPLFIEAIVPMKMFGRVHNGMRAEVAPETPDAKKYWAKVVAVDPLGDTASGTFGVRLELPNSDYNIPAGVKCGLRFDESSYSSSAQLAPAPKAEAVAAIKQAMPEQSQIPHEAIASIDTAEPRFRYRFGPIHTEEQLADAQSLLRAAGLEPKREVGSVEKNRGYIVFANPPVLEGQVQALSSRDSAYIIAHLKQKGVESFHILRSGEHEGRVSLGVLYTMSAAKKHQADLAKSGVESVIKARSDTVSVSWLTTELTGELEARRLEAEMERLSVPSEALEQYPTLPR